MASERPPMATTKPDALGLRIATKAVFSGSRAGLEACKTMAQYEAEHIRLQQLQHDLAFELKRKDKQILGLHKLQNGMRFELKHKDEQIEGHQRTLGNASDDEARIGIFQRSLHFDPWLAKRERSALDALNEKNQKQSVELAGKDVQIQDLSNTIEYLMQEKLKLGGLLAGTHKALKEKNREEALAADAARQTAKQHGEEQSRLQKLSQKQLIESAQSTTTIGTLEKRIAALDHELAQAKDAHAATKANLCKATENITELQAAKALADDNGTALNVHLQQLELNGRNLAGQNPPPTIAGVPGHTHQTQVPCYSPPEEVSSDQDNGDL